METQARTSRLKWWEYIGLTVIGVLVFFGGVTLFCLACILGAKIIKVFL